MTRIREENANTGGSDTRSGSYSYAGQGTMNIPPSSSKQQITASYANRNNEVQSVKLKTPATRRILVVDDDPDITLTFKKAFEAENENSNNNNKILFVVSAYNDPLLALAEFRPSFYDLLLVDINMPKMNGFDFCVKALEIDVNPRVCFMSSGLINQEALREQYTSLSIGCFIRKPVSISYLVRKVKAELE
jgi:two-component system catabolic regulation response regulator CreB/two-component system response regulator ChvI